MENDVKKKIFLPQQKLEDWVNSGKITFSNNIITTLSGNKISYKLIPAYKFLKLTSGDKDEQNLLGLVKSQNDLKHLKPDIFLDSIIIGDLAYEVETGYIGNLTLNDEEMDDLKLLSQYILNNI